MKNTVEKFEALLQTVRALRGQNGCPWDQKQTTGSLKKYLIEEFEEILEAVENNDLKNLCEELGDFLYLIVMIAEINRETEAFSLDNVLEEVNEKLVRRHPHVFSGTTVADETALRKQWEKIKAAEKAEKK